MISYKILLITSCSTFSLMAMENGGITFHDITNTESKSLNQCSIDEIYKKACTTFNKYDPNNSDYINGTIEFFAKIKTLHNNNQITITDIGKFAYNQEESFSTKIFAPSNHLYMSVILERINQYNLQITKNDFSSPTTDEFKLYIENKESENITTLAADCGIYLDVSKMTHSIPSKVAAEEFAKLLQDIVKIQRTTFESIKVMAQRIYNSIVKKKQ
jgi:hypothetical protein